MSDEYFVDDMSYLRPEPRHELCLLQGIVSLQQRGQDNFLVRYGRQIKAGLTYTEAAKELGACLMHQAACDGKLDNS